MNSTPLVEVACSLNDATATANEAVLLTVIEDGL